MKTWIKNATVITMDEKRENKFETLDIVVWDDIIYYIGNNYNEDYDKVKLLCLDL